MRDAMTETKTTTTDVVRRLDRLSLKPEKQDILYFLETRDPEALELLYLCANEVRREQVGDVVHFRAIVEFSNFCRRGCLYCGLNRNNASLTRYRMTVEEIVYAARNAYDRGFQTVVLQSGEDPFYTTDDYVDIIKQIKAFGDIAVTLAFGEKSEDEYRAYYEAGADRYLLKHETSDPDLYHALNPGMSFENRIQCLKVLKKIGYQAGSGIMIGLPGQTLASIADDILLFSELNLDMIGCGPFIPHPATQLARVGAGSVDLSYRVLALNRIVSRDVHLPVTTALLTLDKAAAKLGLMRGGNVIMPNLTPSHYRRLYDIYPAPR